MAAKARSGIKVIDVSLPSSDNAAIYEAGKKMFYGSLDVSRDFAKSMITISTGAIPIYLALSSLTGIGNALPVVNIAVPLVFLVASGLFVIAYFPRHNETRINSIASISKSRDATIRHRKRWIRSGIATFAVGVIAAILIIFLFSAKGLPKPVTGTSVILVPATTTRDQASRLFEELQNDINKRAVAGEVAYRQFSVKDGTLFVASYRTK